MSDAPKPWEEEWMLDGTDIVLWERCDLFKGIAAREGDARLASAAPDAIRLLLAEEWSERLVILGREIFRCPTCDGWKPSKATRDAAAELDLLGEHVPTIDHEPDCARLAALRKAGVR